MKVKGLSGKCFNLGPLLPWSLLIQTQRDKGESESESVFTSLFSERTLKVSLNKKVKSEGWSFSLFSIFPFREGHTNTDQPL